jgi:hypothetical protein
VFGEIANYSLSMGLGITAVTFSFASAIPVVVDVTSSVGGPCSSWACTLNLSTSETSLFAITVEVAVESEVIEINGFALSVFAELRRALHVVLAIAAI